MSIGITSGSSSDPLFWCKAAAGNVSGIERVTIFGDNPDIDTTTDPETVWTGGGIYTWMTAADTVDIVSSSTDDAAAGTGALTVKVDGLDDSGVAATETFTMNGTTKVTGAVTFRKINAMTVLSTGTGLVNAGDISLTRNTGDTLVGHIGAGLSKASSAIYTVAAGKTLCITSVVLSSGKSTSSHVEVDLRIRPSATGVWLTTNRIDLDTDATGLNVELAQSPIALVAGTDLEMRCIEVTANNTEVTVALHAWLIDNALLA